MIHRELAYILVSKLAAEHGLEDTDPDSYEYWETIREAKEFAKTSLSFFIEQETGEKSGQINWEKVLSEIDNLHSA